MRVPGCVLCIKYIFFLLQIKSVSLHFQIMTVRAVAMEILSYLQKQFRFVRVAPKPVF